MLSNGYNQKKIYLPTFIVKCQELLGGGFPMHLNLFGYKLLDSERNGKVYATEIQDMV